jgi:hypothetical protein
LLLIAKVFSEPELDLARIPLIEETILHFMPIWLGKTNCSFFEHEHIDEANLKGINEIYLSIENEPAKMGHNVDQDKSYLKLEY